MASDHQILIGLNYPDKTFGAHSADSVGVVIVLRAIEGNAKVFKAAAYLPSHWHRSFANAARKDQEIESAEDTAEGADVLAKLVAEHLDR